MNLLMTFCACYRAGGIGCELIKNLGQCWIQLELPCFSHLSLTMYIHASNSHVWIRWRIERNDRGARLGYDRSEQPQPSIPVPEATCQTTKGCRTRDLDPNRLFRSAERVCVRRWPVRPLSNSTQTSTSKPFIGTSRYGTKIRGL